jgi:hypothetical protein
MAPQPRLKPIEQDLIGQYGDVQHSRRFADRTTNPQASEALAAHIS